MTWIDPDVVVNVVFIDVRGVALTAALKTASSRLMLVAFEAGTDMRDFLAMDSVDLAAAEAEAEAADAQPPGAVDVSDDHSAEDEVELGNTTPLVSRLSTISSTDVETSLVKMTSAEMEPLGRVRTYHCTAESRQHLLGDIDNNRLGDVECTPDIVVR